MALSDKGLFLLLGAVLFLMACPVPDRVNSIHTSLINAPELVIEPDPGPIRGDDTWTVLYYVDGDNDLEPYLLEDIKELTRGLASTELITVIALVDRIRGYPYDSSVLGDNFTETRLFHIGAGKAYALSGREFFPGIHDTLGDEYCEEYNMGDGETLRNFIEYGKTYYPSDRYALFFSNHGSGVRSSGTSVKGGNGLAPPDRSIAYDETSDNDSLHTGEITDSLDASHSVDLLVYDACLMGLLELGYQYRSREDGTFRDDEFSAKFMVASPPNVWGYGLPYDRVFSRITEETRPLDRTSTVTGAGEERTLYSYAPSDLTPERFGRLFIEEQKIDTEKDSATEQCLALYDLSRAAEVAGLLDRAGVSLSGGTEAALDNLRGTLWEYSDDPVGSPHYDLHRFALSPELNSPDKADLARAVDDMVVASFGDGDYYDGFQEGRDGLGFFFPDGDRKKWVSSEDGLVEYWYLQWWYTGADIVNTDWWPGQEYGRISFCHADGDGVVEGWYEMLEFFYNNPFDDRWRHPDGAW